MIRRIEDKRPRLEHVWQRAGIILRIGRYFGKGDVPRRLDETPKLRLVTGVRSIQKPPTVTLWTGASSG
jgi:hypothetical protein